MSQTYTHEFQCRYDFLYYPFDTQVKVDLASSSKVPPPAATGLGNLTVVLGANSDFYF